MGFSPMAMSTTLARCAAGTLHPASHTRHGAAGIVTFGSAMPFGIASGHGAYVLTALNGPRHGQEPHTDQTHKKCTLR